MTGFAARYDLAHRNISFDYYAWQAHVVLLGATEIVFGVKSYGKHRESDDILARRYRSIIAPGPAMLGLPSREGDDGVECGTHRLNDGIISIGKWDFPRLKTMFPPGIAKYTVTLRRVPMHPERNSEENVWRRFANEIGAVVIEEWHSQPIDLHQRMALYAGATMNFGVVNGPMGMLMLSPYPMQMWGCELAEKGWAKHGIKRGKQVPFLMQGQSLVWERPTLAGLMAAVNKIERSSC